MYSQLHVFTWWWWCNGPLVPPLPGFPSAQPHGVPGHNIAMCLHGEICNYVCHQIIKITFWQLMRQSQAVTIAHINATDSCLCTCSDDVVWTLYMCTMITVQLGLVSFNKQLLLYASVWQLRQVQSLFKCVMYKLCIQNTLKYTKWKCPKRLRHWNIFFFNY